MLKILTLDIETLPLELYGWGLHDQNFSLDQIKEDWSIAVACGKFSNEKHVRTVTTQYKKNIRDDKGLVLEVQRWIEEADVVVGQNQISFDMKKINARAQIHGLSPTAERYQVDTMRISKKTAAHTSSKLAYLTKGSELTKSEHAAYPGFKLWRGVLEGDNEAWKEMVKYCKQDVLATEALSKKLIPWDSGVDFRSIIPQQVFSCRGCGGTDLISDGSTTRKAGRMKKYRCLNCGCVTTEKVPQLTPHQKRATREALTTERGRFRLKVRG